MSDLIDTPRSTQFPVQFVATPAESEAVRLLAELLEREAYRQRYLALTHGALYVSDHRAADAALVEMTPTDRALLSLLALGISIDPFQLDIPAGTLDALVRANLVVTCPDGLRTSGWIVVPVLRHLLFTGIPSTYPTATSIGAAGYLGNDSLLLANALPSGTGKRVLDLGAGSGVQGLCALDGATETVLTDLDHFGLHLAALNVVLTDAQQTVRILCGDTYEPVPAERFDLIVTLPPYVPTVPGAGASAIVAGGPDGLGLLRRLIHETPAHLAPGGQFAALAQLCCNDDGPLLAPELADLAPGLVAQLVSFDWTPLQPYLLSLCTRLATHGAEESAAELIERYSRSLRALGVTGVCSSLLTLHSPQAKAREFCVGPLGRRQVDQVPRLRAPVRTAIDPNARHVLVDDIDLGTLPSPTLALLAVVDGERSVRDCAEAAWGRRDDAASADLLDQAISRFAELERIGVLTLQGPIT